MRTDFTKFFAEFLIGVEIEEYSAYAVNFERETGLTGISTQWRMPTDLPYEYAQIELRDDLMNILAASSPNVHPKYLALKKLPKSTKRIKFFDELVKLNPDFQQVASACDSTLDKAHAVYGAISQFNASDIIFFMKVPPKERLTPERVRRENILSVKADRPVYWVMSDATLENVERQIAAHPYYRQVSVKECPQIDRFDFCDSYFDHPKKFQKRYGEIREINRSSICANCSRANAPSLS